MDDDCLNRPLPPPKKPRLPEASPAVPNEGDVNLSFIAPPLNELRLPEESQASPNKGDIDFATSPPPYEPPPRTLLDTSGPTGHSRSGSLRMDGQQRQGTLSGRGHCCPSYPTTLEPSGGWIVKEEIR